MTKTLPEWRIKAGERSVNMYKCLDGTDTIAKVVATKGLLRLLLRHIKSHYEAEFFERQKQVLIRLIEKL